jgi:hypothetical protein
VETDEFQLVGFTPELFTGNRGILNMSRACQLQFAGSRVCEAEEVMHATTVPEIPRALANRLAWVQTCGHSYPSAGHFPEASFPTAFKEEIPPANPSTDCHGWTSASDQELGMAISLENESYGGFMPAKCALELVAACCAKQRALPAE